MRMFFARDAGRKFGEVLEAADDDVVAIHRYGRPRAVVIGWSLFQIYKTAYDKAMEERTLALLEKSLKALSDGHLGQGQRALALARRLRMGDAPPNYDPLADKQAAK